MSVITDTILPSRKEHGWGLWGAAAIAILLAHLAIALYFMWRPEPERIGSQTPEPILVDLTPAASPPPQPEPPQQEQPKPPEPPLQQEDITPLAVPEPLPQQEAMPQTPLLQIPDLPKLPKAEVTLPAKPPKPQPKKEASKETADRQEHKQRTERSERTQTAARPPAETASPAASSFAMANWKGELYAHIKRFQHYPEAARANGATGTASVVFTLDHGGRVVSARLAGSTGSPILDQEALATIRRASPMPAPPNGSATITVPLHYSLR